MIVQRTRIENSPRPDTFARVAENARFFRRVNGGHARHPISQAENFHFANILLVGLLLLSMVSSGLGEDASGQSGKQVSIYLIGNSLTWDTVPSKLDQDVQWHVDCGKSLKHIYEHHEKPCVKTSTLWPEALKSKAYDIVSVQPHYGTSLQEDVDVISKWVELQPQAVFVIHTGWARSATLIEEFTTASAEQKLGHHPQYFQQLIKTLQERNPKTEFRTTHCMRLLVELDRQINAGEAPLDEITEIYRDTIHMSLQSGRYLMHNAMRETLGQPRSQVSFENVPADLRKVLDQLLDERQTWPLSRPQMKAHDTASGN